MKRQVRSRFLALALAPILLLGCGGSLSINGQERKRMFYVASSTTRFLAAFDLDRADHDPNQPPNEVVYDYDLMSPAVSMAVSPNQLWMFVVNEDGVIERYGIRNNGELSLRPSTVLPAGLANGPLVISPNSQSLYLSSDNGRIYQFSLSSAGAPTPMSPAFVAGPPTTGDLGITAQGDTLFATDPNGNQIWRYTIDGNGALTAQAPTSVSGGPTKIAVSQASPKLLTRAASSGEIVLLNINGGGSLSEVNRVPAPSGNEGPVISENGSFAYVSTTNASQEIWRYSLNPTLSLMTPPRVTNHNEMVGAFLNRLGDLVTMNKSSNSYSRHRVNDDGTLTLRETLPTISQPGLGAYRILP